MSAPAQALSSQTLTSLTQNAVDAVFRFLLALLCLLPLQVGLLLFAFPEFTPQDTADGTHCGQKDGGGASD